jgi:uncharacterized membrane protein
VLHRVLAVVLISSVLAAANASGAGTYLPIELGILAQGNTVVIRSLNDAGQIAGSGVTGPGHRAFILTRSQLQDLDPQATTDYSTALGVNGHGDVVGSRNGPDAIRAFRWMAARGFSDLPPLAGDAGAEAFGINDGGTAVGYSSGPGGVSAVLWTAAGAPRLLPALAGATASRALAINDAGTAVGVSGDHAAMWAADAVIDLGMLAGDSASEALAINRAGDIVGSSGAPADRRAVLWTAGTRPVALRALTGGTTSRALSINNNGLIVGSADSALGSRAVIWTTPQSPQDLNTLLSPAIAGLVLTEAKAINNLGVIIAIGQDDAGQAAGVHHDAHEHPARVVLLVPVP